MTTEKHYDVKGREIIRIIKREKYTINFVRQENLETNLDEYYKMIAKLIVEEAFDKDKLC